MQLTYKLLVIIHTASCADITCWGGGTCIDDGSDPYCDCPIGKALYDDPYYCEGESN